MSKLRQWIESGLHLPAFLRDFHDQKDVFKLIDRTWPDRSKDPHHGVDWIRAQVYVIDSFLRFMALHGYTLQKTRVQADFCDLSKGIADMKAQNSALLAGLVIRREGSQP